MPLFYSIQWPLWRQRNMYIFQRWCKMLKNNGRTFSTRRTISLWMKHNQKWDNWKKLLMTQIKMGLNNLLNGKFLLNAILCCCRYHWRHSTAMDIYNFSECHGKLRTNLRQEPKRFSTFSMRINFTFSFLKFLFFIICRAFFIFKCNGEKSPI